MDSKVHQGKAPPAEAKADAVDNCGKCIKGGKRPKLGNKMEKLTNTEEKTKKNVKKKKKNVKNNKLTPGEEKNLKGKTRGVEEKTFSVVPLTYDQIVEGMLSIGIVSRICDHEMYISLPGRTGGTVSITNISTPYLNILEKYAGDKPTSDDEVCVCTLKDLFQVGQQVVVKVAKVERSETFTKVTLTMNPKDLHQFYTAEYLQEDLVMIAAIQSKEAEMGYALDIGIKRTRCFLPISDAKKFIRANNNRPLRIGQLIYCKIKKIRYHQFIANMTFSVMSRIVKVQKMNKIASLNHNTLMPGMLVDAIIIETHETGMKVRCMQLNALIYQDHMSERWTSPETLEIGSKVPARVLYILPKLTSPCLTLQTELVPLAQTGDRTDTKKLGAKLEVRVVRIEKRGVIVRFEDDDKGIITINHIGNEVFLTTDDISKKYEKDSTHPCRVLQYSPVERMYLCSFKKEDLNSDVVHLQQATSSKKMMRTRNKKKKSDPVTVNDNGELAPEANEMKVDMKAESSDLEEDVDSEEIVIKSEAIEDELEPSAIGFWNAEVKVKDEPASDSDEEPDQSKSKKTNKRAGTNVPENVGSSEQDLAKSCIRSHSSGSNERRTDDRRLSVNATKFSHLALEEPSLNQIRSQKALFFFNFDISDRVLHEVRTRLNLRYSDTLTDKVTHIVYETSTEDDEDLLAPFGWEYMYGLAKGLWQISFHWIGESLYHSRCLPLNDFEIIGCREPTDETFSVLNYQSFIGIAGIPELSRVNREKGNPGLFDGFTFHSYKRCGFGKLSKKNIGYLAVCAGAQLTNREPDPETIDPLEFPSRFHTMEDNNHRFTMTTHVMLYTDRDVPPESKKYDMEHVKTLKLDWLVASLGHFQLVDPNGFL
ncbi:unnamed protein product [Orchesella dallaii]|uniref:Protein RRP5 n=1 Tax=Orchesella dallaii TaxID=48710 RepID=A0ABP1PVZ8_9HEXA